MRPLPLSAGMCVGLDVPAKAQRQACMIYIFIHIFIFWAAGAKHCHSDPHAAPASACPSIHFPGLAQPAVGGLRVFVCLCLRRYARCSEAEQAVLIACLNPDPLQRATAEEVMRMPYFDALRGAAAYQHAAGHALRHRPRTQPCYAQRQRGV